MVGRRERRPDQNRCPDSVRCSPAVLRRRPDAELRGSGATARYFRGVGQGFLRGHLGPIGNPFPAPCGQAWSDEVQAGPIPIRITFRRVGGAAPRGLRISDLNRLCATPVDQVARFGTTPTHRGSCPIKTLVLCSVRVLLAGHCGAVELLRAGCWPVPRLVGTTTGQSDQRPGRLLAEDRQHCFQLKW